MTLKRLRQIIGAGRRRTGLYASKIGQSLPLLVNGSPVKVVVLEREVASFYGGQSGEKMLLRYVREPFDGVTEI